MSPGLPEVMEEVMGCAGQVNETPHRHRCQHSAINSFICSEVKPAAEALTVPQTITHLLCTPRPT